MTINFQQATQQFTQKIIFAFDKNLESFVKRMQSRVKLPDKELSLYTKSEKFKLLKYFDKLGLPKHEMLLSDLETMSESFVGFNMLFRLLRFHEFKEFDLLLKHAQLIDSFCEIADSTNNVDSDIQRCIDNIEEFFDDFGVKISESVLDTVLSRCRRESHFQNKCALNDYFSLLIFSLFAHLDSIIHYVVFPPIEPICLGGLFISKNTSDKYRHKDVWTNPSRSLLNILTTLASFSRNNQEMPRNLYGLDLLAILNSSKSDINDQRGNLIKRAKEGRGLSLAELEWILYDEKVSFPDWDVREGDKIETINIIKGVDLREKEAVSQSHNHKLLCIWLVYLFFQMLYESKKKNNQNQETDHRHYYSRWVMFNDYYIKLRDKEPEFKWPQELIELAQPMID